MQANTAGAGKVAAASLESSNVDLAEEFTNMIITQRAYSANARTITTGDEMLEELIRLKR
ncbi:MAG: flagellar basal body rod C-terminal domain-containing protein [Alphaproteobacteria bacterium]